MAFSFESAHDRLVARVRLAIAAAYWRDSQDGVNDLEWASVPAALRKLEEASTTGEEEAFAGLRSALPRRWNQLLK